MSSSFVFSTLQVPPLSPILHRFLVRLLPCLIYLHLLSDSTLYHLYRHLLPPSGSPLRKIQFFPEDFHSRRQISNHVPDTTLLPSEAAPRSGRSTGLLYLPAACVRPDNRSAPDSVPRFTATCFHTASRRNLQHMPCSFSFVPSFSKISYLINIMFPPPSSP